MVFLLIALGEVFGSPVAGMLAGAVGLQLTFRVFAGMVVLTTLVGPRVERPGTA